MDQHLVEELHGRVEILLVASCYRNWDKFDMMKLLPKGKKCATKSSPSNLSAAKFNEFFTSIARNLCNVFRDSAFPQILVSRVEKDFGLQAVDTSFVRNELAKLKLSKATGLDKIPAKLLKDAASVIA